MRSVLAKGKNVEEAIQNALEELGTTKDKVTTKVIDVPSGGFLGTKYAKVEVTLKDEKTENCLNFLKQTLDTMGVEADITISIEDDSILAKINTAQSGVIIGRRGQTLDALQYLTSLVVNKSNQEYTRVTLDVGDYRDKRKNSLQDLADKIALNVEKSRKSYKLEPMNPYERRIIHASLQNYKHVSTHSEGEEPNRCIVVEYKSE